MKQEIQVGTDMIYYAECQEVFNGYGIRATGTTKKQAKDALWSTYIKEAPEWCGSMHPFKSLEELDDHYGYKLWGFEIGKGYVGAGEERTGTNK